MPGTYCVGDHCIVLPCKFDERNCPKDFECAEDEFLEYGHCVPTSGSDFVENNLDGEIPGDSCSENSPCLSENEACYSDGRNGVCRYNKRFI